MKRNLAAVALICAAVPLWAGQRTMRHYALVLDDPAVADRFSTRDATHSVEAANYRGEIRARQANLKRELALRKFAVVGAVDTLSNAIFVAATPDRAAELQTLPGVKGVIEMRVMKPRMNAATKLINVPSAWSAVGGQSNAGAGIMIGVIGSGIDQTHPAFQDPSLSMPPGFPKCTDGHLEDCSYTSNKVIVARSYVRELSVGSSNDSNSVANDSSPDDYSPRDRSGEGTAIASVIAGTQITGPAVPFSGVAPKAWLGNYRVESSPGMPGGGGGSFESVYVQAINDAFNDGMHIVNLSAGAIALYDPLQTGTACGQPAGVPCDFLAYNFEKAAQRGMVITVAAGDDGENSYGFFNNGQTGFSLVSSPATAPSVIAVGASMNSHVMQPGVSIAGGPSNVQNIAAQTSDAYAAEIGSGISAGAATLPIVDAAQAGNDGYACAALPAFGLYNSVALIQAGNCSFSDKAVNAANAGAVGIVFYMNSGDAATPVETQDSFGNLPLAGPIVMVSQSDGQNLKNYIDAHAGALVVMDPAGAEMTLAAYNQQAASLYSPGFQPALAADKLLGFSSPGPVPGSMALKPDILAPGGFDVNFGPTDFAKNTSLQDSFFYGPNGLYMATQSYDQSSAMYSANGYIAASGTSFAAPMVAGAAALLMQSHRNYTAAQIKALLMNTANRDTGLLGDNWGDNVDAVNIGAGRVDAGAAFTQTVIAQAATSDNTNPVSVSFGAIGVLPATRRIQITNLGSAPVSVSVAVSDLADANGSLATGLKVGIDRPSLTIGSGGGFALVTLSLTGILPLADEYSGEVRISGQNGLLVHLPLFVAVPAGKIYDMAAIHDGQVAPNAQGSFEAVTNGDGGALQIKLIDKSGAAVANSPVAFSVSPRNGAALKSVSGHPSCVANAGGATCNTDAYGIAWAEVFGGPSAGGVTVTASAAGMSIPFDGTILNPPNITSVSEAATGSSNIVAGSYISIYGSGLANPGQVGNNTFVGGDANTFLPYPMNLDGVTVSFDVPGAYDGTPADYSGFPGRFTFVSQGGTQLNVMVPWELQGASSVLVKVNVDGIADSNVVTVPLVTYAPQLFQNNGIAAAIDATTYRANPAPISATNPAHAGDIVELYGNGFGPVYNQPPSGSVAPPTPFPTTISLCTATVGGKDAFVSYCGLAGFPAEYQINIAVPSGLAPGNQPVVVKTGDASTKVAMLPVK